MKLSAHRKARAIAAAEALVLTEVTAVTEETVSEEVEGLEAKTEREGEEAQGEEK